MDGGGPAVDVVDPTGAGDAFDAGLLAAWLAGAGPQEALEAGCAAGAEAVSRRGARPGRRRRVTAESPPSSSMTAPSRGPSTTAPSTTTPPPGGASITGCGRASSDAPVGLVAVDRPHA